MMKMTSEYLADISSLLAASPAQTQAYVSLGPRTIKLVRSCLADAILYRCSRGQKDLQQAEARLAQGKRVHPAAMFRLKADREAVLEFHYNQAALDIELADTEEAALRHWHMRLMSTIAADLRVSAGVAA
jgi:hypothetical protein